MLDREGRMADCIFCRIASKEVDARIVLEDEHCLAFRDLNPQAPVHVLVVPKQHIVNLAEANPADRSLLGHLLLVCQRVARQEGVEKSGYRVVVNSNADAGQTVAHLHFHVLGGRGMRWPPG